MSIPAPPRLAALFLLPILLTAPAEAQAPPATDLFLIDVVATGDRKPVFGDPERLTDRDGYDNQPAFLPDGSGILYTSIRDGQADIFLLDLESRESRRVLETPESEYSPTPIEEGRSLSVVRVEAGGAQRLWRFSRTERTEPELLLPDIEPVGYHAWGADGDLLLFVLGEPPLLVHVTPEGEERTVAENPGRSLHRIPGDDAFSFVDASDPDARVLARFDPGSGEVEPLIALRTGSEDVAWDPAGRAWTADGGRLMRYCPDCGGGWRTMIHLGKFGLDGISRLAFSPDGTRLAFVVARQDGEARDGLSED